jgi:RNA polymerase sigma-70 factor (ECF subfamily)
VGAQPPQQDVTDDAAAAAADAQRRYWGRVLAATLRLARDLDIAEEATADAFVLALQTWPERGVPESVEAWLLTAARRRAIDRVRRAIAFRERLRLLAATDGAPADIPADVVVDAPVVPDDELRLVVLCCHPALSPEAQVALTMRLGCGIATPSVAAAFLLAENTMAARLTRAKRRIAESGTGIDLPDDLAMEERMPAVRRTIHLAYTMGHTAGSGPGLRDDDVAAHAVRLARRLHALRPDDSEATGLLALVLLTEARAATRLDADGVQVLLADADRRCWDRDLIAEGLALIPDHPPSGPLAVQAAIAAEHARAATLDGTDWTRIVALYDTLLAIEPSPTIAIGRCVAMSYLLDAAAGLADLDEVLALGGLEQYPYAHAARAQMLDRLGRRPAAEDAWARAASCARTDAERDYFAARAEVAARGR